MLARMGPLFRKHLAMAACGELVVEEAGTPRKQAKPRPAAARIVAWPAGHWPGLTELPAWRRMLLAGAVSRPEPVRHPLGEKVVQLVAVPAGVRLPAEPAADTFALQIKATCQALGLSRAELLGPGRRRHLTVARCELCWMGAVRYGLSLPLIGRMMGSRDHTTVLHGKRRAVEALRAAGYSDAEAMMALGAEARRQIIADHFAVTITEGRGGRLEGSGR